MDCVCRICCMLVKCQQVRAQGVSLHSRPPPPTSLLSEGCGGTRQPSGYRCMAGVPPSLKCGAPAVAFSPVHSLTSNPAGVPHLWRRLEGGVPICAIWVLALSGPGWCRIQARPRPTPTSVSSSTQQPIRTRSLPSSPVIKSSSIHRRMNVSVHLHSRIIRIMQCE